MDKSNNNTSIIEDWENANNKVMCWVTKWLHDKCKISLDPTSSRWGFINILLTGSLFLVALLPALFAIHLSQNWGRLMPMSGYLWAAIIAGGIGIIVFIFALGLGKYQLDNSKDKSADALNAIAEKIE